MVNCLEPHPHTSVLATSGIDSTIKLWEPMADGPVEKETMTKIVQRNLTMLRNNEDDDDLDLDLGDDEDDNDGTRRRAGREINAFAYLFMLLRDPSRRGSLCFLNYFFS